MKIDLNEWTHAEKLGPKRYKLYRLEGCEVCGRSCRTADSVQVDATATRLRAEGLEIVRPGSRHYGDLGACDALGGIAVCPDCYRAEEPVAAQPARCGLREEWLTRAYPALGRLIAVAAGEAGVRIQDRPDPYLSVGWPKGKRPLGQAWAAQGESGRGHIFLSPVLAEGTRVLDILIHEAIHDLVGHECKHRGDFARVARAVGLEGKMAATIAGEALRLELERVVEELGPYPHEALSPTERVAGRQKCRQRKWVCPECGQIIRAATDDLRALCCGQGEEHEPVAFELDAGNTEGEG